MENLDDALGFLGNILPHYISEELDKDEVVITTINGKKIVYNYSKIPAYNALEAVAIFEDLNQNLKAVPTTIKELRKKTAMQSRQRAFELILMEKHTENKKTSYKPILEVDDDLFTVDLLKDITTVELEKLQAVQSDFFYKRGIISSRLSALVGKFTADKTLEKLILEVKQVMELFANGFSTDTELKRTAEKFGQ